jgi:hypothetical protein
VQLLGDNCSVSRMRNVCVAAYDKIHTASTTRGGLRLVFFLLQKTFGFKFWFGRKNFFSNLEK